MDKSARKCQIGKGGAIEQVADLFINIWMLFVGMTADGSWEGKAMRGIAFPMSVFVQAELVHFTIPEAAT